jgi:hypothetical protein
MTDQPPQHISPNLFAVQSLLGFRICEALVEKNVLTRPEAAQILVKTADDIRSGTEDNATSDLGEGLARAHELAAGWLLGRLAPPS